MVIRRKASRGVAELLDSKTCYLKHCLGICLEIRLVTLPSFHFGNNKCFKGYHSDGELECLQRARCCYWGAVHLSRTFVCCGSLLMKMLCTPVSVEVGWVKTITWSGLGSHFHPILPLVSRRSYITAQCLVCSSGNGDLYNAPC